MARPIGRYARVADQRSGGLQRSRRRRPVHNSCHTTPLLCLQRTATVRAGPAHHRTSRRGSLTAKCCRRSSEQFKCTRSTQAAKHLVPGTTRRWHRPSAAWSSLSLEHRLPARALTLAAQRHKLTMSTSCLIAEQNNTAKMLTSGAPLQHLCILLRGRVCIYRACPGLLLQCGASRSVQNALWAVKQTCGRRCRCDQPCIAQGKML